jgi:hypothetical protein
MNRDNTLYAKWTRAVAWILLPGTLLSAGGVYAAFRPPALSDHGAGAGRAAASPQAPSPAARSFPPPVTQAVAPDKGAASAPTQVAAAIVPKRSWRTPPEPAHADPFRGACRRRELEQGTLGASVLFCFR